MITYYDILGIKKDATDKDVKYAYRAKAKIAHPDTATGSNAAFIKVREAYDVLMNPIERQKYDQSLIRVERPEQKTTDNRPSSEQPAHMHSTTNTTTQTASHVKYKINYNLLVKWFINVFVISLLINVYVVSLITTRSNYYLSKSLHISSIVLLISICISLSIGFTTVLLLHKMRLNSWIYVCMKFFGHKFTKFVIKILMIRPPKIYSLSHLNHSVLTYAIIGVGLICINLFKIDLQNWVVLVAGLFIIGAISIELRIRYGLYFIYLTCISLIISGLITVIINLVHTNYALVLLAGIVSVVSELFLVYTFNRRFWFH